MFPSIDLGIIEVPMYWVLSVLGFLVSYLVIKVLNKKHIDYHLPKDDILYLTLFIVIGALIGARILFVLTLTPKYIHNPIFLLQMFLFGGLVFYGGVIGGVIGGIIYIRKYGLVPSKYFNIMAVVLPLGHAHGRVGCFCAGCCHGIPTDHAFAVSFPPSEIHPNGTVPVHPTQLYESFFNLLLFGVLLFLFLRFRKHRPFLFFSLYLMIYGVFRFFLEFLRGDDYRGIFILSTSQWISVALVLIGALLLIFGQRIKFFNQKPPTSKSFVKYLKSMNEYESKFGHLDH